MESKLKIKKVNEKAKIPMYGSVEAAGFDLYGVNEEDVTIKAHETVLIKTGLSMEIPTGYAGLIFARSGLATKKGLAPANCVGVVDADYRGEVMVALHNHTNEDKTIEAFERIAQMIIMPYLKVDFEEVEELTDTERGQNGFGSTGKK